MIVPLITLVQNYSYDKTSNIVKYYEDNVFICYHSIYINHICYNYRNLPKTMTSYIYNCFNMEFYELPKRYVYSNMHI